jgi:hypothetical protein
MNIPNTNGYIKGDEHDSICIGLCAISISKQIQIDKQR